MPPRGRPAGSAPPRPARGRGRGSCGTGFPSRGARFSGLSRLRARQAAGPPGPPDSDDRHRHGNSSDGHGDRAIPSSSVLAAAGRRAGPGPGYYLKSHWHRDHDGRTVKVNLNPPTQAGSPPGAHWQPGCPGRPGLPVRRLMIMSHRDTVIAAGIPGLSPTVTRRPGPLRL